MCMICVDVIKGSLTPKEIAMAWMEQPPSDEHFDTLMNAVSSRKDYNAIVDEILVLEAKTRQGKVL